MIKIENKKSKRLKAARQAKRRQVLLLTEKLLLPVGHVDRTTKNFNLPVKQKSKTPVASTDFLSSYAWRKLRMQALKLHGAKCQCCGATPATGAVMNVDHIKPRKLFPNLSLELSNLQVLCHECNHGKGNWDMTDWRIV
jgi:5-methylcytosine-specific restriction endonuclease McrA